MLLLIVEADAVFLWEMVNIWSELFRTSVSYQLNILFLGVSSHEKVVYLCNWCKMSYIIGNVKQ